MLKDITLGQYYQTNSLLHRLDSRVKIMGTLVYIISLFLFRNVFVYMAVLGCLVILIKLSKVPFSFMVRGLKPIMMVLFLTVLCNLLFTPGTPVYSVWIINVTREGMELAFYMSVRFIMLMIGSTLLTLTTTPTQLTDGLESVLSPLRKINVPVHEVAMMMSIALRFIPILMEEADKIMKAQLSRGADFETGNIIHRVKGMLPLLVPLFISAFKRADELAMAMDARCYRGGEGRSKMRPLIYKNIDKRAYMVMIIYLIVIVAIGVFA